MHDPIATGRRAAMRALAIAAAAVALLALALLPLGLRPALAVLAGGGAALAGNAVAAAVGLGGGIVAARTAFVRLLLGVGCKWLLVLVVVLLALEVWRLPPLPLLAGLVAGIAAWLLALNARGAGRGGDRGTDMRRQA